MANKKISELTAAGALTGAELVEIVQGGVNVRTTTQGIANLAGPGGGTVESVTGDGVDNTDPANPVIDLSSYYTSTETDTEIQNSFTYAFNDETDSYTLTFADFETPTFLRLTKTGAATVTIPLNSVVAIPIGRALIVKKVGTGDITYAIGGGGTIVPSNGEYTSVPNQQIVLLKEGTDTWGLYNGVAIDATSLGLVPDTRQVAGIALDADITLDTLMDTLGVPRRKRITSDVVNDNATPDTMQDITGLSFAVAANTPYWFRFFISYTSAATTTGSGWSVNGPALTSLKFRTQWTLSSGTISTRDHDAYDEHTTNATSFLSENIAIMEGYIECSASGTVIGRFASEVANSAITVKANYTFVEWKVIEDKP